MNNKEIYKIGIMKDYFIDNNEVYYQIVGLKNNKPFIKKGILIFKTYKEANESLKIILEVMKIISLKYERYKLLDTKKSNRKKSHG